MFKLCIGLVATLAWSSVWAQTPRLASPKAASFDVSGAITNPDWVKRPNAAAIEKLYPVRGLRRELTGRVLLRCRIQANGNISECIVVSEDPTDIGFGASALLLAQYFVIRSMLVDGEPMIPAGREVMVPIDFRLR